MRVREKKVHGKRRASERLSSSPAARDLLHAPKRARLGDRDGVEKEENEARRDVPVPHLDLAAKWRAYPRRSLESKRRAQGGRAG